MNHRTQEPEQSGTHMWLRYSTQFSVGERSYTVEMGIPVPVGASAEQREQLLREAEAGMGQLTHVVEKRVSQMLRQSPASTTSIAPAAPAAPLKASPAMPQTPQTQQIPQRPIQKPTPTPASYAAPPTASLSSTQATGREARNESGEHRTVGIRPASATDTSMPAMPRFSVGSEANIPLPDFITAIRDNLNLTPKQAMTMLKVKSLTSINLREALENLQAMIAQGFSDIDQLMVAHPTMQDAANRVAPTVRNAQIEQPDQPDQPPQTNNEVTRMPSRPLQPNHEAQDYAQPEPVSAIVREQPSALNRFDEEINPDEQLDEDELEDLDEPDEDAYGLSDSDRLRAKELLDEMQEMRGTHTASAERLKVLNRLVLQQIEQNQLKQLAQGVWGAAPAKLKVDQAEYIINWAKQDDFIGEAEAVLLLLEEESYARGNR